MSITAIAKIAVTTTSLNKKTIRFRLLDSATREVKEISVADIRIVLLSNKVTISNLKIAGGIIMGSNGSLDRLPTILDGKLVGKSSLIIINQVGNTGYNVSDFRGNIIYAPTSNVIAYAKENGIANGKIVKKSNGEFISAIGGKYEIVDYKIKPKTSVKTEIKDKTTSKYTGTKVSGAKALQNLENYVENLDSRHQLALKRECSNNGVSYKVLASKSPSPMQYENQQLEYIYYTHKNYGYKQYDNIVIEDHYMTITGLDGVYEYDMNKIHSLYGRKIYEADREYRSVVALVNSKGELHSLDNDSDGDILEVPEPVKKVLPRSILVNFNNTVIFGPNIDECSRECFKTEFPSSTCLMKVYIRNNKIYRDVVEAVYELEKTTGSNDKEFNFDFVLTPEYMIDNIIYREDTKDTVLFRGDTDYLTEEFIDKLIKYTVSVKLNNLDILNIKTKAELKDYRVYINKLEYNWKRIWSNKVSAKYRENMTKYISSIGKKFYSYYYSLE